MFDSSLSRLARKTTLALAIAVATAGVAQADLESARQSLAANDFQSAITDLDGVLEQSPKNAEARFLKGLALARSGDTAGALKVFNSLVEDEPKMAEAWNNLGVLRARNGDLTGARDALQKATTIDPQHGPAQENLGDIYVALARNAYGRAGELESDNAIARAKSQQLAAFIGSGQNGDQSASQASASSSGPAATATPPAVPNVTRDSNGQASLDTGTPEAALQSWARAWSAQDVNAYLAMYSDQFVPDDGASRTAWAAERRERVSAPSSIDVSISDVQVSRRGDQALVRFNQRYRSNTYQDQESKALLMGESGDGWQILREGSAGSVDFTTTAEQRAPAQTSSATEPSTTSAQGGVATTSASGNSVNTGNGGEPTGAAVGPASQSSPIASSAEGSGQRSAPAEMQAASQAQAERNAVRQSLQDWANAWSEKDMQTYMNAYSDNYSPSNGQSRTAWVQGRRAALSDPEWIKIELSDIDVSVLDADRALATFNQHYESNSYEDRERKRVTLVHEDGGWRIVRES